jgi:hypothetical protein
MFPTQRKIKTLNSAWELEAGRFIGSQVQIVSNRYNLRYNYRWYFSLQTKCKYKLKRHSLVLSVDSGRAGHKIPSLHWTRNVIFVFTKARHRTLSRANRVQLPHQRATSLMFILILCFSVRLSLQRGHLPSIFQPKCCKLLNLFISYYLHRPSQHFCIYLNTSRPSR